jgi:hypothetical protein
MIYERNALHAMGLGPYMPRCRCDGPLELLSRQFDGESHQLHYMFRCRDCQCVPSLIFVPKAKLTPEIMERAVLVRRERVERVEKFVSIENLERQVERLHRQLNYADFEDLEVIDPSLIPLLKADAHRWGNGLIHQIDEDRDQTICGKSPGGCPGTKFWGRPEQITCKSCLRSIESRAKYAEQQQGIERLQRQQQLAREERNRQWWEDYNAYLQSPEWRAKRAKVMRRANGMCEGCGERPAVQVHHLRYPLWCMPGSPEWITQEKLFHLRAICISCHTDVHPPKK